MPTLLDVYILILLLLLPFLSFGEANKFTKLCEVLRSNFLLGIYIWEFIDSLLFIILYFIFIILL